MIISKELLAIEPYILIVLFVHIVISLVLALILAKYIAKRFVNEGDLVEKRDKARVEAIAEKSLIFHYLFSFSLHKNNPKTSVAFLFLFNLSTPLIGYLASIWIAWYLRNVKYDKKVTNTNILNLDEFGISFLKVERIFGEGSMSNLMVSKYAPKSKKLKALSTLASNISPANLRIVKQTLSSTDDEIRMFGYAIINKTEKALNSKMNQYLSIYNTEIQKNQKDEKKIAEAARELAPLYWEMIYTELSHESLRENFLKEVIKYVSIAQEYYVPQIVRLGKRVEELEKKSEEESSETEFESHRSVYERSLEAYKVNSEICIKLYILIGRVHMLRKEYENAMTVFTIAQELNDSASSYILPYLAEIHYLQGNYKTVNSILNRAEDLGLNATLYPIVEQWKASS